MPIDQPDAEAQRLAVQSRSSQNLLILAIGSCVPLRTIALPTHNLQPMTQDTETDYEAIEREKQMFRDLSQALSKPVTYYAQSEAIDSLVEKYGPSFQALTKQQKLLILAMITIRLSDGSFEMQLHYPQHVEKGFLEEWGRLIALSSDRDRTGLMLAITTQLHDKVYAEEDKP